VRQAEVPPMARALLVCVLERRRENPHDVHWQKATACFRESGLQECCTEKQSTEGINVMTQSESHRQLLLQLGAASSESSSLLAYVNLMGIVALGWSLSVVQFNERFHGRLSSPSGSREVRGDAPTVAELARELVHRWMGGTTPLTDRALARIAPLSLTLTTRGECQEDAAICDCAYHDNARRAEESHR
jgi:hypothetical protein